MAMFLNVLPRLSAGGCFLGALNPHFVAIYQYRPPWVLLGAFWGMAIVTLGWGVKTRSVQGRLLLGFTCGVATLVSLIGTVDGLLDLRTLRLLRTGQLPVVEGKVEHFVPEPDGSHSDEHFEVGGVNFAYRQSVDPGGYHQGLSYGGIVRPNQYLRITYLSDQRGGSRILKIEIDSTGSLP